MNELILLAALVGQISITTLVPTFASASQKLDAKFTCTNVPNERKVDCSPSESDEKSCTSKGCCWHPATGGSTEPWCFHRYQEPVCANILDDEKFDCFPRGPVDEKSCSLRGCCWHQKKKGSKEPWCFYPKNFRSYVVSNSSFESPSHRQLILKAIQPHAYVYPKTIETARIKINYESKSRLRINITDALHKRFEPPYPKVPIVDNYSGDTDYEVLINEDPFGFAVVRKKTQTVIFDTRGVGGLILSDQFLQISSLLPTKYLYGLGERRNKFLVDTSGEIITLFNHDIPPRDNVNLYGSHPFYLAVEKDGTSHGIFLLNGNAMDIIVQPAPAITYRTIGGILDFYIFLGPTPADVIRQYLEVIGNPVFPPYWSFGFQISRWGWKTLDDTIAAYKRTRDAEIPLDVVWNDIDYMGGYNNFVPNSNYSGLRHFVDELHGEGLKYMVILDPGVASELPRGQHPPYDEALKLNILVKNSSGLPSEGKVWNEPKGTVFPDFSDPKAESYWCKLISELHENISMDGLWLDMNEVSNFVHGSKHGCSANNLLDDPPYLPHVEGGRLNTKTLCMSDIHAIGSHYDVHNSFALLQGAITNRCLQKITKKRPFILSRSTFSGSGHFVTHWTGDVSSNWEDMKHSVTDIINFNLFGIPMVGADICGFFQNATEQMCQRWSQLGAFYPFSRNHNANDTRDQDPGVWGPESIQSTRRAVSKKYRFLPYLYTLFWRAHTYGDTVIRPLFFDFPADNNTLTIDTQFMWGSSILIVPVLTENATDVNAFFPKSIWYNLENSADKIVSNGEYRRILAPLDTIPVFIRGGSIIPWQGVKSTTFASRQTNFGLDVALDEDKKAFGTLFWDDGESFLFKDVEQYNLLEFNCTDTMLTSKVSNWGYRVPMKLGTINLSGLTRKVAPAHITLNGREITSFSYNTEKEMLSIEKLEDIVNLSSPLKIVWTY